MSREGERDEHTQHPTLIDIREAVGALPRAVVPMRPRLATRAFNSPEYIFELKWDGIRALAGHDATRLSLADRAGGEPLSHLPGSRATPPPEALRCESR